MTTFSTNNIRVFVHDCRLSLSVGVHEHERQRPQTVIAHVDVEAEQLNAFHNPDESDLSRVIDYSAIYRFLTEEIPAQGHIALLETLADAIIDFCFKDPRAQRVTVRLEKPDALPNAVGGIERCRAKKPQ